MRFVSIPPNGASWSKQLIYSFDTELDEKEDVDVEIFNQTTHQLIARKRLYGVTRAEVDIAPILRSAVEMVVPRVESTAVLSSPMGIKVAVGIMGLMSAERRFCAAEVDIRHPQLMSYVPDSQTLAYGEEILFSVIAPEGVQISMVEYTPTAKRTISLVPDSNLLFYDVVICTSMFRGDVERIELSVMSGTEQLAHFNFDLVPRLTDGRRLVWRNRRGGLESYRFTKSLPIVAEVDVDAYNTTAGLMAKLRSTKERYRLCSALEYGEALRSLREIIYAPYIYDIRFDRLEDVTLATRRMEYSRCGELQSVALEIVGEWKGGER